MKSRAYISLLTPTLLLGPLRENSFGKELIMVSYAASVIAPCSRRLSNSYGHLLELVPLDAHLVHTFLIFRRDRLLLIIFWRSSGGIEVGMALFS